MPNAILFALLQSSIFFGYYVYEWSVWPPWFPDVAVIGICSLPTAACLLSFTGRFRRHSRWIAGSCFFLLACIAIASGIVLEDKFATSAGMFSGTIAVYVMATGGRYGEWRGNPYSNFLFAAVAVNVGVVTATMNWKHWWFNAAFAIAAIPVVVGFLLNKRWTKYWASAFCLLIAIAAGFRSTGDDAWLTSCLLFSAMAAACPFVFREKR